MLGQKKNTIAALVITVAATALLVAPAAAEPTTVGQFLQELARAKKLVATDPQIAADALASSGIRLPRNLDLGKPLTEGDVTSLAGAAGLNLASIDETAEFSARQMDQFFAAFSGELGASSTSEIELRGPGNCALNQFGICAVPGADCLKNGKPGFCQPTTDSCTCNTGKAKGKRKQVGTQDEPE